MTNPEFFGSPDCSVGIGPVTEAGAEFSSFIPAPPLKNTDMDVNDIAYLPGYPGRNSFLACLCRPDRCDGRAVSKATEQQICLFGENQKPLKGHFVRIFTRAGFGRRTLLKQ